MSPEMSYGRHAGPAPATARQAAVLILLFRRAGHWYLPLTERPATLSRHGGQISLPGGAVDVGESSSDAALRELSEELGIDGHVELLGCLADCHVFASNYLVTPWIAAMSTEPQWRPHDHEVQAVLELPLETLLAEDSVGEMKIERGPLVFRAPCIRIDSACIWGATSVILGELADVLGEVLGVGR
jgi:8-oxo-dGTP pyrophosphatase MutT (NUDIX family)